MAISGKRLDVTQQQFLQAEECIARPTPSKQFIKVGKAYQSFAPTEARAVVNQRPNYQESSSLSDELLKNINKLASCMNIHQK